MNSQSWPRAQPPTDTAWLMLRAGLTERLVTGIPEFPPDGLEPKPIQWEALRNRLAL